jgi:hypothetical protein
VAMKKTGMNKRDRLRTELYRLTDRELMGIGITCGEIDYFASNQGIDPQGIRSADARLNVYRDLCSDCGRNFIDERRNARETSRQ